MSQESFEQAIDLEGLDGSKRLGRRSFLVGALATGAAISAPVNYAAMARGRRIPLAKDGAFKLGVAAGFPRPQGIALWTQLDGIKQTSKINLTIAKDRKFRQRRRGAPRQRPQGPRLHGQDLRQRAEAPRGVLLPLHDRGIEVRDRPLPHGAAA